MDGRNPRDRALLEIGMLEMVNRNVVRPKAVLVSHVRSWFSAREQNFAETIIEELATDADAPLEYVGRERACVWLTDRAEAEMYIEELRENPPWFDP